MSEWDDPEYTDWVWELTEVERSPSDEEWLAKQEFDPSEGHQDEVPDDAWLDDLAGESLARDSYAAGYMHI